MATTSSTPFTDLFSSAPRPMRTFLHAALQLRDLQELYTRAHNIHREPLSRSVLELLGIHIQVRPQDLERVPRSGPVVVIANHPFGLLDALVLDTLLFDLRPDVKILANSLLCTLEELRDRCLPVEVFNSDSTSPVNVSSARLALKWLRDGHGIALFPAGEVAHWQTQQRCITDPPWSDLASRYAKHASVVPVYFAGANGLAFQIAGFLHPRLRTARLPGELLNKRGATVEVHIGNPISSAELAKQGSVERKTSYLRARTYVLGYSKPACVDPKFARALPLLQTMAAPETAVARSGVAAEIHRLHSEHGSLVENESFAVYAERGNAIPEILREIGRLREATFRAVGEGTGQAFDLDAFDSYYTHMVLWHKQSRSIAGSYRLAWTQDVLPIYGFKGLYTSTLFRFAPAFFRTMGPAVELGRSFVRAEFQKEYAPLMLLWQAISCYVVLRPEAPVLFGPVSISAEYSDASRELMVQFLSERRFRSDLTRLVAPRRAFRSSFRHARDIGYMAACLNEVSELSAPIADLEDGSGVPVLLRHYLRLGGRVAAFNLDRSFANALDGLLILDLRETPKKLLAKYMGAEASALFLERARA